MSDHSYMAHGEISGTFEKIFADKDVYDKLVSREPQHFTLTVRRTVRWWKRPWYWVRRKPTSWEQTYTDVVFDQLRIVDDGGTVQARFETSE